MQTVEVKQDRFDGGITSDGRDNSVGMVKMIKHFDVLTTPHTLSPFISRTDGDKDSATQCMTDFLYWNDLIYGVGQDTGTGKVTVHKIATDATTLAAKTWSSMGNNAGTSGNPVRGVFIEYHGKAYGFYDNGLVWVNDLAGGAWNEAGTGTSTTIGSSAGVGSIAACVHSKDDSLYMATKNVIGRNANGVWTPAILVLPVKYVITSLCEYGEYLAIACMPMWGGNSIVILWDRSSSDVTLSVKEIVDWGFGNLQIIQQIEGELIGISFRKDILSGTKNKLIFRHYISGAGSVVFRELNISASSSVPLGNSQKFNSNRLYFLADISIDNVLHNGIWGVGKNSTGRWIVWFDKLPNNDPVVAGGMRGFFMLGDYTLIAYEDSGYKLSQTYPTTETSYLGTSLVETVTFNCGDSSKKKGLVGVTVTFDSLPSAGIVLLKYRKDGETSWTQIFTEGTDGSLSHSAVSIENLTIGGDTVSISIATPAVVTLAAHKLLAGQKIRFSTTGALPTGITAGVDYYVIATSLAADTFKFSDTVGGSAINTSGSQSGVHTMDRKVELPEFKEIELRIESTGGAKITGWSFKANILDQKPY